MVEDYEAKELLAIEQYKGFLEHSINELAEFNATTAERCYVKAVFDSMDDLIILHIDKLQELRDDANYSNR